MHIKSQSDAHNFLYSLRGASEIIFEIKSLAHLKIGGNVIN